jgi:hypothetical protein
MQSLRPVAPKRVDNSAMQANKQKSDLGQMIPVI